jgi:hypothetical protein
VVAAVAAATVAVATNDIYSVGRDFPTVAPLSFLSNHEKSAHFTKKFKLPYLQWLTFKHPKHS